MGGVLNEGAEKKGEETVNDTAAHTHAHLHTHTPHVHGPVRAGKNNHHTKGLLPSTKQRPSEEFVYRGQRQK